MDTLVEGDTPKDTYIEIKNSDGKTYRLTIDEYLFNKKITAQFGLVPKIIIGYIFQLMISFVHAIFLLNLGYEESGPYVLPTSVKMLNWIVFVLFFYMYMKSAQKFSIDFMALMNNNKVNEQQSKKYHQKLLRATGGICLALGIMVFIKHCSDPDDIRVRLSYSPLGLCVCLAY